MGHCHKCKSHHKSDRKYKGLYATGFETMTISEDHETFSVPFSDDYTVSSSDNHMIILDSRGSEVKRFYRCVVLHFKKPSRKSNCKCSNCRNGWKKEVILNVNGLGKLVIEKPTFLSHIKNRIISIKTQDTHDSFSQEDIHKRMYRFFRNNFTSLGVPTKSDSIIQSFGGLSKFGEKASIENGRLVFEKKLGGQCNLQGNRLRAKDACADANDPNQTSDQPNDPDLCTEVCYQYESSFSGAKSFDPHDVNGNLKILDTITSGGKAQVVSFRFRFLAIASPTNDSNGNMWITYQWVSDEKYKDPDSDSVTTSIPDPGVPVKLWGDHEFYINMINCADPANSQFINVIVGVVGLSGNGCLQTTSHEQSFYIDPRFGVSRNSSDSRFTIGLAKDVSKKKHWLRKVAWDVTKHVVKDVVEDIVKEAGEELLEGGSADAVLLLLA
jgi:hypothetical protein